MHFLLECYAGVTAKPRSGCPIVSVVLAIGAHWTLKMDQGVAQGFVSGHDRRGLNAKTVRILERICRNPENQYESDVPKCSKMAFESMLEDFASGVNSKNHVHEGVHVGDQWKNHVGIHVHERTVAIGDTAAVLERRSGRVKDAVMATDKYEELVENVFVAVGYVGKRL